jgi:Holliday junction resolvase RusA-like endonuclease
VTAYRAGNKSRDLDNILKAILDLLVSTQTIKDDSQVVDIWARWVDEGVPCTVKVEPIPVTVTA